MGSHLPAVPCHFWEEISNTFKVSSEALQKFEPGKSVTVRQCRDALAEVCAHRLTLATEPDIAFARSMAIHDGHTCDSSCDRQLCEVNQFIFKIDSIALRSAEFADTHFTLNDRGLSDKRSDNTFIPVVPRMPDRRLGRLGYTQEAPVLLQMWRCATRARMCSFRPDLTRRREHVGGTDGGHRFST